MGVIEAWLGNLQDVLAGERPVVADARIGVFYTAARLADGAAGVAFTPRDLADTVCCPRAAAAAPLVGRLAGRAAWDLAREALSPSPLRRAVGVAVLNALSAVAIARHGVPGGRVETGADALEAAGLEPTDRVVMVGTFTPFIKALRGRVARLSVIDRHPEALRPAERPLWVPPHAAATALAEASVALVTGSALVEGGLDDLLTATAGARAVILAGPTASPWPPPFFARGVTVLGGVRVLDADRMLRLVGEGGAGHSFDGIAEKVAMIREPAPAGAIHTD